MKAQNNLMPCQENLSYCKFGAQTILELLNVFRKNIKGVTENSDIECVHKTRVTSRKLRAALPIFQHCYPSKTYKKWHKQIKKVTRALGEARDLDVQILFIQEYMKQLNPSDIKCINILLADRKRCRKRLQKPIIDDLKILEQNQVLNDICSSNEEFITQQANIVFDPSQVREKAHWHICSGIDDFLSLGKFVRLENEIEKHHEMRINAKKLRYTMEFFAALYGDELETKINTIKAYQDILGEKHDYEVWIDFLPKFISELASKHNKKIEIQKIENAITDFLNTIEEKKNQRYSEFVNLWEKNKKERFFEELVKTIGIELNMGKEQIDRSFSNPDIKIAVLSDIHANLQALETVIEDANNRGVNAFLNAGDSIGFGACPNEVIELLCEKQILSVVGNYDLEIIEGKKTENKGDKKLAFNFTKKELSKASESYLFSLPRELRLEIAGKKALVTHGSPESIDEHIYHDTPTEHLEKLAKSAKAKLIIIGHSHEQFFKETNGACFIDPGSVGRPGDGNPQTGYAILSFNPFKVDLIRLDYNVKAAADSLRRKGLPESISQMILRGVSIDSVYEQDQKILAAENCSNKAKNSKLAVKRYSAETEHSEQVTKLALQLFGCLKDVYSLGNVERCWLECASILHDVGMSISVKGHHKHSASIILDDVQLPFASTERRIIANIARYHRKALPKQNHYNLLPLDKATKNQVKVLASLLRIADGLDYTHQSIVKNIDIRVGTKKVTVECTAVSESLLEEQAFTKKKDLFEEVFQKQLVLTWKIL